MSQYSDSKFNFNDPNTSWYKTFQMIPKESTVLDIGCSSGVFGRELIRQKKCTVDGIEIDKGDIAVAKKNLRDVYELNIETDSISITRRYDVIFMGDVIEHLARPVDALKKIKKLLNKNGKLVFSMPNITHMSVRLMLLKGDIEYGKTGLLDETHLHFYNSKEIYRVLNTAGFRVDKLDYTTNDIPHEQLKEELLKIGLKTTEDFKDVAKSLDAVAYQFVGSASKTTINKQPLPKVSPKNIVNDYIIRLKKENKKNLDAVLADRDRIKEENAELKEQLDKRWPNILRRNQ